MLCNIWTESCFFFFSLFFRFFFLYILFQYQTLREFEGNRVRHYPSAPNDDDDDDDYDVSTCLRSGWYDRPVIYRYPCFRGICQRVVYSTREGRVWGLAHFLALSLKRSLWDMHQRTIWSSSIHLCICTYIRWRSWLMMGECGYSSIWPKPHVSVSAPRLVLSCVSSQDMIMRIRYALT